MLNNPQPQGKYDAVLSGENQSSEWSDVLGSIEDVKLQMNHPDQQTRIAEISQALNYVESILDLVIQALNDESIEVRDAAYSLLNTRIEKRVKQALKIFEDKQLKSAVGINYRKLRGLLKVGMWDEADEETARVMLRAMDREEEGRLRQEDIDDFPCEDLHTIDQLWIQYSDGKFGFSEQKRIYQGFGGTKQYDGTIWEQLIDEVEWTDEGISYYRYLYHRDRIFNKKAPQGHLPCYWWYNAGMCRKLLCVSLLSRRDF
ncbi:GUN4 domain-containing protein [Nodularia chucula]|uniref:GUN4 domain-containing protein n=1 Tax=Nodularia chucula TaxID=3093667 RepID=UPI0039C6CD14